ncbi:MAG: FeoB-associated Cys-rich membrane protein [Lachnospiraceae bacterium]|nr:FeoB-associated Cys-rich membrane protein [Lachnospiraceae bacterium]
MGTLFAGACVLAIVGLAIRSMYKDKKAGKSLACGCDCKHCSGGCHR